MARGKSRSDTIANILKAANEIAATGVKEIVLTGVNIGDFGIVNSLKNNDVTTSKPQKESFLDLIRSLDKVEGIERFRISSIEPNLLTDEIIEFVSQSKKFVPHFHVPLQSGSNTVLGLMKRRYKRELYTQRVQKIKALMPHCCIGVDVIVGHPGETKECFLETYNFLNELDISYLHVFSYSERENTDAVKIFPKVANKDINERSKMLHILSDKKRREFYQSHLGNEYKVLFEDDIQSGNILGFTENYIRVTAKYDPMLVNDIKTVKLESINENGNVEVVEAEEQLVH
jgi:threonylcarbamoyladenosine tRNA methylthiotransferase MtaB